MAKHSEIEIALSPYRGQELTTAEIVKIVNQFDPLCNRGNVFPNDHADGNKGACWCAWEDKTGRKATADHRLFDKVRPSLYRVLTPVPHFKREPHSPSRVTTDHGPSRSVALNLRPARPPALATPPRSAPQPIKTLQRVTRFELLGVVTVAADGYPKFPPYPPGGGLYRLEMSNNTVYIGETKLFARRFREYCRGADDIWTELTMRELLISSVKTKVYTIPVPEMNTEAETRALRKELENQAVLASVAKGEKLWNAGHWRCEHAYLPFRLKAINNQIAAALARYEGQLNDRRRARLTALDQELSKTELELARAFPKWRS